MSSLNHLKVIDLSRVLAGPYCTMLLADYGAEVIKIEQPGLGDGTRQWGPPWVGDQSAYFLTVNRNKKSMTLNLRAKEGREILFKLLESADVLVENFKVGKLAEMGLDYEPLAKRFPQLVYCSITGYGQTGPDKDRAGYDFMIQAEGGIMSITGPEEGPPSKVGVAIVDITAGLFASHAILAALIARGKTGQGQYIDVSLLDAQVAWLANVAHNYLATGERPGRYGNGHANIVPYQTFATADGHLALAVGTDRQYKLLCELIDRPDLWADTRFQTNPGRVAHRDQLIPQLAVSIQTRSTAAWLDLLRPAGIPAGAIKHIDEVLTDPHVQARKMVQQIDHPTAGPVNLLGPVAKLSLTPAEIAYPPPLLGQHNREILQSLGYQQVEIEGLIKSHII
ncbi:MAG: CoA transferase [Ardenticatenaceae bacterium]|nr:CoA transferase [Ardenticatenaceae bacterium]